MTARKYTSIRLPVWLANTLKGVLIASAPAAVESGLRMYSDAKTSARLDMHQIRTDAINSELGLTQIEQREHDRKLAVLSKSSGLPTAEATTH